MSESFETILIVDDSLEFLETVGTSLEDHYSVICTADPRTALMLVDGRTRLLLSDVMMPNMTGMELANQVRDRHPAIKVLLMSGLYPQPSGYPMMRKPFRFVDLLAKIRELLGE